MSREIDKAWLEYFDKMDFGKTTAHDLKIARLAFVAGYEAAKFSIERTDDEDGEEETNPYLLTGDELARAESAARSR